MWEATTLQIASVSVFIYVGLVVIELAFGLARHKNTYEAKDTLCSITMGLFYLATKTLLKGVTLLILFAAHRWSLFDFGVGVLVFIAGYIAVDFVFYWLHRGMHEVRFGWAAHVNHHSSQHFNLGGTALRQSFFEPVFEAFIYAPIVLIGFDPFIVLAAIELNLIYMFWVHTEHIGKLPRWFEWCFVTPSHHRVHHAANIQYLDKNYSGTFIVWDRIFGTFEEEIEKPHYGILHQIETHNPIKASLHEWRALGRDLVRGPNWKDRVLYLIKPPGWAPGGQGLTTRQRQAEMASTAPTG
jgi:sterol desaturase/sphingolipid hydroxylase (fatty acid hydroxylase superfamily)